MPKKLKWPIAKMREDGMVAIWLSLDNWLIVRDGIVRKYLDLREEDGARRARRETRSKHPLTWKHNQRLAGTYALLDQTESLFGIRYAEALNLYTIGWQACLGGSSEPCGTTISPEKLVSLGDAREERGYQQEFVQIAEASPNWLAEQREEVA